MSNDQLQEQYDNAGCLFIYFLPSILIYLFKDSLMTWAGAKKQHKESPTRLHTWPTPPLEHYLYLSNTIYTTKTQKRGKTTLDSTRITLNGRGKDN